MPRTTSTSFHITRLVKTIELIRHENNYKFTGIHERTKNAGLDSEKKRKKERKKERFHKCVIFIRLSLIKLIHKEPCRNAKHLHVSFVLFCFFVTRSSTTKKQEETSTEINKSGNYLSNEPKEG